MAPHARWIVRVLGPLQIVGPDGRAVEIAQTKVRVVLAYLALADGAVVSADQLAEALWADEPPRSAMKTLQGYIARLRRWLSRDLVRTSGNGYSLDTEKVAVDTALLTELLQRSAAEQVPERRAVLLFQALELFRGDPLTDVPSEFLHSGFGVALTERRLVALEDWADIRIQDGHSDVLPVLRPAVNEHPYRERLWELLITAQAARGLRNEALKSYRQVHDLLRDQLGIGPGADLQRLHRQILAHGTTGIRDRTAAGARDNLDQELATILSGQVGVILHGGPGVGKSTVARHAAEAAVGHHPGGITAISLAGQAELPGRGDAVRQLLLRWQLPLYTHRVEMSLAVRREWQSRRCLVLVDDVRSAAQIEDLLPAPPGCGVIVCGTASLVSPPGVSSQLVGRFTPIETAALLRRQIGPAKWDADPLAAGRLVEFSDGLAVAIEVISMRLAGRSAVTTAELAERLAAPQRRLAELRAGEVSVARHFRRAYERLDPLQRRAFRLLGLLRARSFPPHVAAACLQQTLTDARNLLEELHEQHLLESDQPALYRFGILERLFARELSEYSDSVAQRVAAVRRALSAWHGRNGGAAVTRAVRAMTPANIVQVPATPANLFRASS